MPDPHGFYSRKNLARLWKGLRSGARMSCHPTDPRMAEFEGYESLAEREVAHECAGALVLAQRELMTFQDVVHADPHGNSLKTYRAKRPNGLTRIGLVAIVERSMLGGTVFDPVKMALPDLRDPEIGYALIGKRR